MLKKLLKKEQGFTLIEIVLVLAIAGLILVIVFLAVSGAQRSRRDSARKSDASRYLAAAEQYASNNAGTYPTCNLSVAPPTGCTGGPYVTNFNDPSTGSAYTWTNGVGTTATKGSIRSAISAHCDGTNTMSTITPANNRVFAVQVHQENGSSYCADNE